MQTLAEFNEARSKQIEIQRQANVAVATGIACPECGAELIDPVSDVLFMSNPPKRAVSCTACGFSGYRLA